MFKVGVRPGPSEEESRDFGSASSKKFIGKVNSFFLLSFSVSGANHRSLLLQKEPGSRRRKTFSYAFGKLQWDINAAAILGSD